MSDDHFTVGGTLIDTWASMKTFQRKQPGQPSRLAFRVTH